MLDLPKGRIRAQELEHEHPGRCPICHSGDAWYEASEVTEIRDSEPMFVLTGMAVCREHHRWRPAHA